METFINLETRVPPVIPHPVETLTDGVLRRCVCGLCVCMRFVCVSVSVCVIVCVSV
jgi:hypothetical protein